VQTPSGIDIEFFQRDKDAGIKRHYEIRPAKARCTHGCDRAIHDGCQLHGVKPFQPPDWETVPSISTIADLFPSDALTWWGQDIGVQGVLELYSMGKLLPRHAKGGLPILAMSGTRSDGSWGFVRARYKAVVDLMKEHYLTTTYVKSAAGDRGTSVHGALEQWAKTFELPDPEFYPPEERGYIAGLRMFLEAIEHGNPQVIASERMVASTWHGFAGRYDLEIGTTEPCQIVNRWQPKRGPKTFILEPSLIVPDLKTTKGVYSSHFAQLEGYEIGRRESGHEPSDTRAVIRVHPGDLKDKKLPDDPHYEFVRVKNPEGSQAAFLAALTFHNALEAQ
jgi:hypothetical protein